MLFGDIDIQRNAAKGEPRIYGLQNIDISSSGAGRDGILVVDHAGEMHAQGFKRTYSIDTVAINTDSNRANCGVW